MGIGILHSLFDADSYGCNILSDRDFPDLRSEASRLATQILGVRWVAVTACTVSLAYTGLESVFNDKTVGNRSGGGAPVVFLLG